MCYKTPSNLTSCVSEVSSSLLFCKDENCFETSTKPYSNIYLNEVFTMTQMITNLNFKNYSLSFKRAVAGNNATRFDLTLIS